MPKPNYAFAKRQRDLAKQQKKQEKQNRKSAARNPAVDEEDRAATSTAPGTPLSAHQSTDDQ
jgi:hypothetical protein